MIMVIFFSENIYFHEDMNEKHSFLRDTCMLTGGAGKRGRLTLLKIEVFIGNMCHKLKLSFENMLL